ncbi:glycosyltransferase [Psychrobacillus lasiicapitis]|uniref:Glycosyltransferase n=1 Tax=Psychrobacillus lasiicapitis TaxID=1636719 RepID=A0A544TAC8_9BACI|nr:glycosyltransferase [Psychrobacillus lasiicapitis]TQR14417.1 glycosyltransferase [Psychrobacillus lasiicapitis]GGA31517.1 hypothetical protein GCM10011384_21300 [Psychrobacillus lasiicapitis]
MAILNPNYEFLKADYANPNLTGRKVEKVEELKGNNWSVTKVVSAATPVLVLTLPSLTFAADNSFDNLYPTLMRMFDSAVVLVIVFAGASWALGHRSKAIELLIGVCCGYLLARNAVNIRDFLKTI